MWVDFFFFNSRRVDHHLTSFKLIWFFFVCLFVCMPERRLIVFLFFFQRGSCATSAWFQISDSSRSQNLLLSYTFMKIWGQKNSQLNVIKTVNNLLWTKVKTVTASMQEGWRHSTDWLIKATSKILLTGNQTYTWCQTQ